MIVGDFVCACMAYVGCVEGPGRQVVGRPDGPDAVVLVLRCQRGLGDGTRAVYGRGGFWRRQ